MEVKLIDIGLPKRYVRHHLDQNYVNELVEVARANKKWPFPPISIAKGFEGKQGRKTFRKPYELIDGRNRIQVAHILKVKTINATLLNAISQGERALLQFTLQDKGLRIDKDKRDAWVRILRNEFKLTLAKIAKEIGLTEASASRICSGKQRGEGLKKATKPQSGSVSGKSKDGLSPRAFIERIAFIVDEFTSETETYVNFIKEQVKNRDTWNSIVDRFLAMAKILAETKI